PRSRSRPGSRPGRGATIDCDRSAGAQCRGADPAVVVDAVDTAVAVVVHPVVTGLRRVLVLLLVAVDEGAVHVRRVTVPVCTVDPPVPVIVESIAAQRLLVLGHRWCGGHTYGHGHVARAAEVVAIHKAIAVVVDAVFTDIVVVLRACGRAAQGHVLVAGAREVVAIGKTVA